MYRARQADKGLSYNPHLILRRSPLFPVVLRDEPATPEKPHHRGHRGHKGHGEEPMYFSPGPLWPLWWIFSCGCGFAAHHLSSATDPVRG